MVALSSRDEAMPEFAATRRAPVRSVRNQDATTVPSVKPPSAYEAGSQARRFRHWQPGTVNPNALLAVLATLRDRSRQSTRNDPYGRGVVGKLVTNIIGTGIVPRSQAKDPELCKRLDDLFLQWTDVADADNGLEWYGLQALATRGFLEGGEMFIRRRPRLATDGLVVPLQVQVLEPELCPHTHTAIASNGNRIRAGIEFDKLGRRTAYYFHPTRPELDDYDTSQLKRIPAHAIDHLYEPLRAGQLRGLPLLTAALVKLFHLDKITDARTVAQELQNLFVAFLTSEAMPEGPDPTPHPLTGTPAHAADDAGAAPSLAMEPGIIQQLLPGEDVKFATPPNADNGLVDFIRSQLRAVAVAADIPYELLSGDMTGMNDRTVRVALNEFKRRLQMWQHHILVPKFCRPVWLAFIEQVYLHRILPIGDDYLTNPHAYTAVEWAPARFPYLHPVQDVQADREAILAGFTTRRAVVAEYGQDVEAVDAEQAADNERADRLGLRYTSDGRVAAAKAAAPTPPPGADAEPNENGDPQSDASAGATA